MKKKLLNIVKYGVFLAIGLFLVWWQLGSLSSAQREEFFRSLKNTRVIYILPIFVMAVISHYSRAVRWKLLLEPMGYKPRMSNTFYATLIGYLGNLFVPRAGEVLRCSLLTKYERVPFPKALGTVIIERLVDVICLATLILLTVLIQMERVSEFVTGNLFKMGSNAGLPLWIKGTIGLAVVLLIFLLGRWLLLRYRGHRFVNRLQAVTLELKEGLLTIARLKKRKEFLFHTFAIWALYLLQVYVGFNALAETEHLGMAAAMSVLMLSTIAMIVSPGGIGAFPVAVQQVLLLYGLNNLSFGWLMWGVNTGIILILGIASFLFIYFQNKKHETNSAHSGKDQILDRSTATGAEMETIRKDGGFHQRRI